MAITFTGLAQQMPYNPDANGDDFVGVDDVLGVLGIYDTALMQPDLQCDYEGTEFENLIVGLLDESLILDSVYVEYTLVDTIEYFTLGCPDPVQEEIVLSRSYTLSDISFQIFSYGVDLKAEGSLFGYDREVEWAYRSGDNHFEFYVQDDEVDQSTSFSSTSYWSLNYTNLFSCAGHLFLPFPDNWFLDEDGIQINLCQWAGHASNFRLIPFWHEAE